MLSVKLTRWCKHDVVLFLWARAFAVHFFFLFSFHRGVQIDTKNLWGSLTNCWGKGEGGCCYPAIDLHPTLRGGGGEQ